MTSPVVMRKGTFFKPLQCSAIKSEEYEISIKFATRLQRKQHDDEAAQTCRSHQTLPDNLLEAVEAVPVHELPNVGTCSLVLHTSLN